MKRVLVQLVCGACLLLLDVGATFTQLDPHAIAAQSLAQSRHNGRPPIRTLNPAMHRSDFTYRGGYSYHYQPPPPGMSVPVYLYPPAPHHRPPIIAAVPSFHQQGHHSYPLFKGPAESPHHYHHAPPQPHPIKGPLYSKTKGPCPAKAAPTAPTPPVVTPRPTNPPTTPSTTTLTTTATLPTTSTTLAPSTTTPALISTTPPVSTQSGLHTSTSPVETEVKVEVVEDPCKCEARLAFQKQTQAALQQLNTKIATVSQRIEVLEGLAGQG